jgi:glycosyltransferase involved in cell wall biosynthesis
MERNPEMQSRPLVTFALLAYNQEKYVRDAIQSAFSQTYVPLEIILSDDGSSDGTYRIMQEMAASYDGPHTVVVRRSEPNQGLVRHFMTVAGLAEGRLVIEAGGDDISKPERTMEIVRAWQETGAWALYSRFDRISEDGGLVSENVFLPMLNHAMRNYWIDGNQIKLLHGAVSAYTKEAISLVGNDPPLAMTEDGVVSAVLHFHQKSVHFLEKSLVMYRENPQALSNAGAHDHSYDAIVAAERKAARMAPYFKNLNDWLLQYRENVAQTLSSPAVTEFCEYAVRADIRLYDMAARWIDDASFLGRAVFLLRSPRGGDWRWMLPRLFGLEWFAWAKSRIGRAR